MLQLNVNIAIASLLVWIPDSKRKLSAATYTRLRSARAHLHKRFPLQHSTYSGPLVPATISTRRSSLATGDDMASPMYTRMDLIKRATDLRHESDKDLRPVQRR